MKFKTDENLPQEAADLLIRYGFDAHSVDDEHLSGTSDDSLSARAKQENRVLITLDLDFSNIRAYPPAEHVGIVILRLKSQDKITVLRNIERLAAIFKERSPAGELWIVERDRIRFRTT